MRSVISVLHNHKHHKAFYSRFKCNVKILILLVLFYKSAKLYFKPEIVLQSLINTITV